MRVRAPATPLLVGGPGLCRGLSVCCHQSIVVACSTCTHALNGTVGTPLPMTLDGPLCPAGGFGVAARSRIGAKSEGSVDGVG
jgi:hypothetical protein